MVHVCFYARFNIIYSGGSGAPGVYFVDLGPGLPYTLGINGGQNCCAVPMGGCEIGGIDGRDLALFGHLIANAATYNGRSGTGKRIFIAVSTGASTDWLATPSGPIPIVFNDQILQGNFTMYI